MRAHSSGFELDTSQGPILASNVVVATGPYQLSRLPHIHRDLPARLLQLHASEYRSPTALPCAGRRAALPLSGVVRSLHLLAYGTTLRHRRCLLSVARSESNLAMTLAGANSTPPA